ncbi:hypothetical protein BS78_06G185700 [Paspalum vaginatum]|nr:hypothetical protein BS78_06G185700 [Paspalum vaginatum]
MPPVLEGSQLGLVDGDGGQVVSVAEGQPTEAGSAGDGGRGHRVAGLERQAGEVRAAGYEPLNVGPGVEDVGQAQSHERVSDGTVKASCSSAQEKRSLGTVDNGTSQGLRWAKRSFVASSSSEETTLLSSSDLGPGSSAAAAVLGEPRGVGALYRSRPWCSGSAQDYVLFYCVAIHFFPLLFLTRGGPFILFRCARS